MQSGVIGGGNVGSDRKWECVLLLCIEADPGTGQLGCPWRTLSVCLKDALDSVAELACRGCNLYCLPGLLAENDLAQR